MEPPLHDMRLLLVGFAARYAATVTSLRLMKNGERIVRRRMSPRRGVPRTSGFPIQNAPPGTHTSSGPGSVVHGTVRAPAHVPTKDLDGLPGVVSTGWSSEPRGVPTSSVRSTRVRGTIPVSSIAGSEA